MSKPKRPSRARKPAPAPLAWLEAILAAGLLVSFFLPWLSFLGAPVPAHRIRETLEGPHRLLSAFTRNSQVSLDYSLSLFLWAVPFTAASVLVLALLRRSRAWAGFSAFAVASPLASLAAGLAAVAAFLFLRVELRSYPFQKLEEGAWMALLAGLGLLASFAARAVSARRN